nr:MAG TPA: hypothetical protein [Caudoviricetes sp.]
MYNNIVQPSVLCTWTRGDHGSEYGATMYA